MLDRDQQAFAATILNGPAHLPPDLFAGDERAIIRGLKVHANTISHARLVALEESFPRTRDLLGAGKFNDHSRDFLDRGGATGRCHARIGDAFPDFLEHCGAGEASALAQIEWRWLQSYHAADAVALGLDDLAALDGDALLALDVVRHPAAVIVAVQGAAVQAFDPDISPDCAALLMTRPESDVRVMGVSRVEMEAIARAEKTVALGNLMALFVEDQEDGAAAMGAFIAAGALQRANG